MFTTSNLLIRTIPFLLCICAFLFGVSSAGNAAVYYVSTSGSDSNNGTAALPWLTIQKAANMAQAGDTIIVKSGNYDERVSLPSGKSGTPSGPITFRADPRRTVYLKGFKGASNDYMRIEGFNITYDAGGWLGGGIWLAGNYWEIVDNYFFEVAGAAIQPTWQIGKTTNYVTLRNNHIYKCNKGFVISGIGWLVENNEVERLVYYNEDADYSRFFGENHIIRNNYFHGTVQSDIGSAHVDGFQTFGTNGECSRNIVIENNIIKDFFHEGMMMAGRGCHDNITVRNNIFSYPASWGICAFGISSLKVYNNVFAYIRSHGIGFRLHSSGTVTTGEIKNNIFFEVGSPYWKEDGCYYEATNNLLYKNGKTFLQASYPNDLVNIDPMFVDASREDFDLRAGSPAIDAAVSPLADFFMDIRGIARPQGSSWDIGAYESTQPNTRPAPPVGLRLAGD